MDNKSLLNKILIIDDIGTYEQINEQYFQRSIELGRNQSEGVVETPDTIVRFMIKLSIINIGKSINKIRWYDPCSGSGKFPYQILKMAISELDINFEEDLPEIYFSELSEDGYLATFNNIKRLLFESGFSIERYIESGRLKGFLGDALEINANVLNLFSDIGISADVVIGNPPYVRSTRIDKKYKAKLKSLYPEIFNGNEDMYSYFFANASNVANKNGIVCFISPQSFMKKKSSKALRTYLTNNLSPLYVIDLDENNIFNNVSTHSVITCMAKNTSNQHISYYHAYKDNDVKNVINGNVSYEKIDRNALSTDGWSFSGIDVSSFNTRSIKEFGLEVRSGIRPSIKSAYVYKIGDLHKLPPDLKKETIDAKGIVKWCTQRNSKELLFLTKYNSEHHHLAEVLLEAYKEKLAKNQNEKTKNSWMWLRPCAYYDEMENEKIIYPDISQDLKFSLDKSKSYVLDGAFFINSNDLVLLGILNSSFALEYFKAKCTSLGNTQNKGRLRLKKYFIENFPLPSNFLTDETRRSNISKTVREIIELGESKERLTTLNGYVNEFYIL